MSKIILEDFNEGDGCYKINLAYLNKEQIKEVEALVSKWNPVEETEDERIRKDIFYAISRDWLHNGNNIGESKTTKKEALAWLKKQGDTNETVNSYEFAQGVLRGAAINLITWIDYNAAEGNMCLSNMECNDIENALISGDWNKIYAYIKKKLEKQGEQNLANSAKTCKNEQKSDEWHREDEQNLNACLGYIPDEFLRRWLKDAIYVKYDKPADKVEPKFHVRDWVVTDKGYTVQIAAVNSVYTINNGMDFSTSYVDKYWRLWTIRDAKYGDVLTWDDNKCIALFQNIYDEHSFNSYGCVGHCTGTFEAGLSYHDIKGAHPATKEQCNILFSKMHVVGYMLDVESKKLIKVEDSEDEKISKEISYFLNRNTFQFGEDINKYKTWVAWLQKQGEQKPKKVSIWKHWKDGIAGNGEGKQTYLIKSGLGYSISSCLGNECDYIVLSELDELLQEEKQGNKQKWTEEDDENFKSIDIVLFEYKNLSKEYYWKMMNWIKSLKQRMEEQQ